MLLTQYSDTRTPKRGYLHLICERRELSKRGVSFLRAARLDCISQLSIHRNRSKEVENQSKQSLRLLSRDCIMWTASEEILILGRESQYPYHWYQRDYRNERMGIDNTALQHPAGSSSSCGTMLYVAAATIMDRGICVLATL